MDDNEVESKFRVKPGVRVLCRTFEFRVEPETSVGMLDQIFGLLIIIISGFGSDFRVSGRTYL